MFVQTVSFVAATVKYVAVGAVVNDAAVAVISVAVDAVEIFLHLQLKSYCSCSF